MSVGSTIDSAIGFITGNQNTERVYAFDNPFAFDKCIKQNDFVSISVEALYRKILTDCYAKSAYIAPDNQKFYWDTVVKSYGKNNADKGLISLLANAMSQQQDLFVVFQNDVLRAANFEEQRKIQEAFKDKKQPFKNGFWFSFTDYKLTSIIKTLDVFQYILLTATYTSINISKSIQLHISKLREDISKSEKASATEQAKQITEGMKDGKSILIDLLDKIELAKIDMTPTKTGIEFINGLKAYYLNAPLSYVCGQLLQGISTTGESDNIAVERCIEGFFHTIFKPVSDEIFKSNISFVSDNWRMLQAASDLIKTLEMTTSDTINPTIKENIVNSIFKDFINKNDTGKK
ncbi:MAG: hypothetical protein LBT79_01995 [Elusimicrobiota bacterium]|jgi:hypothetical protein|nr:hypothetical protein [Elusimicrobiota bacterium]